MQKNKIHAEIIGPSNVRGRSALLHVFPDFGCTSGSNNVLSLLAVEQRCGLLERPALRLDDEDVAEHGLEHEPDTVHNLRGIQHRCGHQPAMITHVVLPLEVLERDRIDVLVEDERQRDGEVEDVEALGPEREW